LFSFLPRLGQALIDKLLIQVEALGIDRLGIRFIRQVENVCQVARVFIVMGSLLDITALAHVWLCQSIMPFSCEASSFLW